MYNSSPAIYSSEGRITRLLVFDTKQFLIKAEECPNKMFREVWDKYKFFVYDMNAYHEMEICICFQVDPKGHRPKPWLDPCTLVNYIPVNYEDPDCSVPSAWAQDCIHITSDKVLCTHANLLDSFVDVLRSHVFNTGVFKEVTAAHSLAHLQGGNVLRGKGSKGDFLLVGNPQLLAGQSDCQLRSIFNLDKSVEIIRLFDPNSPRTHENLFFHVDLYASIIGSVDNNQWLFLANAIGKCEFEIDTEIGKLNQLLAAIPSTNNMMRASYMPFIVLEDEAGKPKLALSYNNCIIENYMQGGKQHRCIYLPDYREALNTYVVDLRMKTEPRDNKQLNFVYLQGDPITAPSSRSRFQTQKQGFDLSALIENVQKNLRQNLTELGFDCVRFVRFPFYADITRLGALHCRVKVIERDCL